MKQVIIPTDIDEAISSYHELGESNHVVYVIIAIAKRENVSIPDAHKLYKAIYEKIGNQSIQDVYAVLSIADTMDRK